MKEKNEMDLVVKGNEATPTDLHEQRLALKQLSIDEIDALEKAEVAPYDLTSEYWTPNNPGEKKRVIFDRIDISIMNNEDTGEMIELKCAFFYAKENGSVKCYRNGSKRLVGALESQGIIQGLPLEIIYLGKKSNTTNSFKSDHWEIHPLVIPSK